MMTDNDLCASMRGAESWWSCPFASILWPGCLVFEFWAAAVLFSIDLGWEHTPFETISRKWWYASVGPEVWFGEVRIETIRRIGSVLWTIWDAAIISVQEIFSFNVLHFARRYQLKSPVIITRFPSISQVFLPIVPTRRPGWQLASGCCYCYYTPDNDSTHTHTLLAAQKSRLFFCVLARTTHFPASGKKLTFTSAGCSQNRLGFMKRLTSGVAPCCWTTRPGAQTTTESGNFPQVFLLPTSRGSFSFEFFLLS